MDAVAEEVREETPSFRARERERTRRPEADRWLLLLTFFLVAVGLVFVLSASQALAYVQHLTALYFFQRQLISVGIGALAMLALMRIDYHRLRPLILPGTVLVTVLLVLVPLAGVQVNGARRWFAVGPLVIQPTEMAKLAFGLFMSAWVVKQGDRLRDLRMGFVPFVVLLGGALGLVILERDLGTALVIAAILVAAFVAGGGRKRHLALLLLGLLLAGWLTIVLEPYRFARLAVFVNPFQDQLNAGFQSTQALYALGSGGIWGVGIGHSVQKFLWLPEAHTDFIFAIIGEETGLVGTTLVLLGFAAFAVRGYRAAMRAPDRLGLVIATAITTWIAFQALVNMATVTDTLPITGVPLPLISYGGSSVAMTLAAVGVLLNVASQGTRRQLQNTHRQNTRREDSQWGTDAPSDFGRRERWARDAGPGGRPRFPR
ncbi:MAG: putative lipid II flippase FtsW [Candidatus Dormibacteraeota bacterium]|nr:putative lipid II flippase FtsW [Candidatus Dormibacteraeota bacterium]